MQVHATTPLPCVEVSAKGPELTSRAGTVLLSALADRLGLTEGLTAALHVHSRKVRHEPGRVVRDLGHDDRETLVGAHAGILASILHEPRRCDPRGAVKDPPEQG